MLYNQANNPLLQPQELYQKEGMIFFVGLVVVTVVMLLANNIFLSFAKTNFKPVSISTPLTGTIGISYR